MSGEDRLCKRDAIVIHLVHWKGGYCILYGTICDFLFENLFFVCYSQKVLFSTRPTLENKQTCVVRHRGVIWVSGCVVPLKEEHTQSCSCRKWSPATRRQNPGPHGRGSVQHPAAVCQKVVPVLEPSLHLRLLTAGQCCWEVALPRGQQPRPLLWGSFSGGAVSACTSVCVSFLRRHLNFSYIYITDLFTNEKCYVL